MSHDRSSIHPRARGQFGYLAENRLVVWRSFVWLFGDSLMKTERFSKSEYWRLVVWRDLGPCPHYVKTPPIFSQETLAATMPNTAKRNDKCFTM